ncbi:MAG TPA: hypothetical protein VEQ15_00235 [Myxococcales bacterium]|nr:hypothetical protein [Myxococcales bacterium]
MPPAALGKLAEELAPLAAAGTPEAARQIGLRIREESVRHGVEPWELTALVGGEWARLGIISPAGPLSRTLQ